MSEEAVFRYIPSSGQLMVGAWHGAPEIIDSWLHIDGQAIAVDAHFSRFAAALAHTRPSLDVEGFLDAVTEHLPDKGSWFPRLEYARETGLALRLRPAPTLKTSANVWTFPAPDPRTNPGVKGPDLVQLKSIQRSAAFYQADEAILINHDGHVLEGTTSALMWWEHEALCVPAVTQKLLPSITRAAMEAICRDKGIFVRHSERTPEFVADHPCWILNALHGIRPVTGWVGFPDPPQSPAAVIAEFRAALAGLKHRVRRVRQCGEGMSSVG